MPLGDEFAGLGIDGAGVAAADVDAEGDAGKAFDERVVGVDGPLKVSFRILAAGAHSLQRYFVDISGIARGIDLNVFAAGVDQLGDHLPLDFDDMLDKVVEPFVDIERAFPFEALGDAVGAEDGNFSRDFGDALGVAKFCPAAGCAPLASVQPRRAG